ncbi:MAG: hypothetical protein H0W03_07300 [Solirubrobacterales bacterium]|nr:hypothetical protein [Solirubrobacterales bacterium]
MARRHDSPLPFGQAYHPGGLLTIGFESARVTSSDYEVDLTNSGINQILSVAAVRGHRLLHFSMADLHDRDGSTLPTRRFSRWTPRGIVPIRITPTAI